MKFLWDATEAADRSGRMKAEGGSTNLLQEYDESDVTQADYTLSPSGSGSATSSGSAQSDRDFAEGDRPRRPQPAPQPFGNLVSQRRDTESSFYSFDALGSTRELTDSSEVETDDYTYEAFGKVAASSGTTENPFQWVGQVGYYADEETSLYSLRRRQYGSGEGRFVSEDPIRFLSGSANPYRYSENNPHNLIDPSGLGVWPPAGWTGEQRNFFAEQFTGTQDQLRSTEATVAQQMQAFIPVLQSAHAAAEPSGDGLTAHTVFPELGFLPLELYPFVIPISATASGEFDWNAPLDDSQADYYSLFVQTVHAYPFGIEGPALRKRLGLDGWFSPRIQEYSRTHGSVPLGIEIDLVLREVRDEVVGDYSPGNTSAWTDLPSRDTQQAAFEASEGPRITSFATRSYFVSRVIEYIRAMERGEQDALNAEIQEENQLLPLHDPATAHQWALYETGGAPGVFLGPGGLGDHLLIAMGGMAPGIGPAPVIETTNPSGRVIARTPIVPRNATPRTELDPAYFARPRPSRLPSIPEPKPIEVWEGEGGALSSAAQLTAPARPRPVSPTTGRPVPVLAESPIPRDVRANLELALEHMKNGTQASWGGKWRAFHGNYEENLPKTDVAGNPITYDESYLPKSPGDTTSWGANRVVVGSDGYVYVSTTHYGKTGNPPFVYVRFEEQLKTQ